MEIPHKSFNTGKTSLENHKELLFICEVKKWIYFITIKKKVR
jgi:hypothetical protein